jgi:SAM-dependent methyltransferase
MASDIDREAQRIRDVYERRASRALDSRYDYYRPANLFIYQSRERALTRLLDNAGLLPLTGRSVLDAGCGDGGVLRDLVRLGATPACLTGVDLLPERIEHARELTPGARLEVMDAQALPFPDQDFGLVLGFTLLSSVTDPAARARVASEMSRVCARDGAIVLYDFWINPFNRDVRALSRKAVSELFPGWEATLRSVTLAPPIVRALAPLPGGWVACTLLEVLPFLRTHFLVALRPPAREPSPPGSP